MTSEDHTTTKGQSRVASNPGSLTSKSPGLTAVHILVNVIDSSCECWEGGQAIDELHGQPELYMKSLCALLLGCWAQMPLNGNGGTGISGQDEQKETRMLFSCGCSFLQQLEKGAQALDS